MILGSVGPKNRPGKYEGRVFLDDQNTGVYAPVHRQWHYLYHPKTFSSNAISQMQKYQKGIQI